MELIDLPNETLLEIFKHLSANKDISNVSLVCKRFNQISCDNLLWAHFARQDYGVNIKLTKKNSVKIIYQKLLHLFGPLLGLWQVWSPTQFNFLDQYITVNISQYCGTFFCVTSHYSLVQTCSMFEQFFRQPAKGCFTRICIKIFRPFLKLCAKCVSFWTIQGKLILVRSLRQCTFKGTQTENCE